MYTMKTIEQLKAEATEVKEIELLDQWEFRDIDPNYPETICELHGYSFNIDGVFYTNYIKDNANVINNGYPVYLSIWTDFADNTKRFAISNKPFEGADEAKILSGENLEYYITHCYKPA